MTNYEKMFKQLFMLGNGGVYLTVFSGHTWIEQDENADRPIDEVLLSAGVSVNNKIYGGIAEALDTMDAALQAAGQPSLEEQYDEFMSDGYYRIGDGGVGKNRIDIVEKGKGGLY